MLLTIIYVLTLLGSFIGLLYYVVDSFENKEYGYSLGFGIYSMFILFLLGQAIKMLIMMI